MKHNYLFILLLCLTAFLSCHKKDTVQPVTTPTEPTKPVTPVTPSQPLVYHQDGEVKRLVFNDPNGVNIVVLGDAFIKDDLDTGGYFDQQVKSITDYLFSVAPFKQNKQHFNIYVVYAQSNQRGATKGYIPGNTNTKFNSYFDLTIDRLLIVGNTDTCYKYIQKALPLDQAHMTLIIVNDPTYGGSGGALTVASTNAASRYVMVHEIGHSFGGLADEYVDDVEAGMTDRASAAFFPNVDTTNDPAKIKWGHFLDQVAYNGVVGAYVGGYYRAAGVYRPEIGSIMTNFNYLDYNAPSREAIVRKIDTIMHIPFNFNDFLKADAGSIQPIFVDNSGLNIQPPRHDFINMRQYIDKMKRSRIKK